MKLGFCGGAQEVGASCILLNLDGKNIVLDCGMRMGGSKEYLPDLSIIQENGGADAIVISHAHMDHTGSLPVLSREYPEAKICMTHATKDLVRVLLYDSLKIMEYRETEIPIFAEVHVKNMLDRILCFSPGFTFRPFDNDVTITFYNASHVAGAASVYISGKEGSFFYSGDFSLQPQKTVEKASFPKLRPDIAVIESTYGDRLHSSRETEERKLVEKVGEIIKEGKKILIPAFALGRAQEVILILKSAINKGVLPPFRIYTDGMVNDICRVYKLNPNYLKRQLSKKIFKGTDIFFDDNVIAVSNKQQREEIVNSMEPCCIISSSGMLSGGPSQWYAEKLAPFEGNFIAITGYQDEESPGRQLLELSDNTIDSERFLKLGESNVPVKCGIGKFGLSAHADKTGIISLTHSLSAKKVYFVHGNREITSSLANDVQKEYQGRIYAPANSDIYEINLTNPRKQLTKTELGSLKKSEALTNDNIKDLWHYIIKTYGNSRAFTIEEIFFIWSGREIKEEEVNKLIILINTSPFFEAGLKYPFMFHAIEEDIIASIDQKGPMESNSMLSLIDTHFPQEAGIYKKGARFDEKTALIYFNFPQVASKKYENEIKSFEEISGWKVETNEDCNLLAVQNLITSLLPSNTELTGSVSYYRNENLIKAALSAEINEETKQKLSGEFLNTSGINLDLITPGQKTTSVHIPVRKYDFQMEQNQALSLIDEAFQDKPDKIYRKSIKSIDGVGSIELSFISPAIGEKYRSLIDELESRVMWSLRINPTPNQNEIFNIGTRLFAEKGIQLKKNLAYLPKEMVIKAVVSSIEPDMAQTIKNEFWDKIGMTLIINNN
ncbi:MBL fold metallo-hydrolase [Pseudobacteroides cellulosolvens]|uniref:Beta-Casp domain containing protein n=1 Tax=Pseudobacteroides cellulosolvens ATCC 35603 = DSM 2933 TaxID=398512 RepID=A0A0L6JKL1_9FIRM|nr:MBL fold metallo-hydrolase [Pseudobacteroides cellulosolvens]KNY26386.1 Beta-Casp domain containing protein [Pseudobacteroides cellulosolvens ATCC 35603 = DSM 2933]